MIVQMWLQQQTSPPSSIISAMQRFYAEQQTNLNAVGQQQPSAFAPTTSAQNNLAAALLAQQLQVCQCLCYVRNSIADFNRSIERPANTRNAIIISRFNIYTSCG